MSYSSNKKGRIGFLIRVALIRVVIHYIFTVLAAAQVFGGVNEEGLFCLAIAVAVDADTLASTITYAFV